MDNYIPIDPAFSAMTMALVRFAVSDNSSDIETAGILGYLNKLLPNLHTFALNGMISDMDAADKNWRGREGLKAERIAGFYQEVKQARQKQWAEIGYPYI